MNSYFRRQLADYVEYHRDWWNGVMHVFGIIFLFTAAVLPLHFWSVHAFGGIGIAGAAVLLLSAAAMIVSTVSVATVWSISAVLIVVGISLQIVGHRIFERRQPALLDNPTHLLLGPMFVMAKLFIALGFRRDLALIIHPVPQAAHPGASFYADARHGETHPNS